MSTPVKIFDKALTTGFVASRPLQINATDLTLFFDLDLSGGPTTLSFYLEFTADDPNDSAASWRREVDEVDDGTTGGVTHFQVTRTFGALADGVYNLALQFARRAPFVRVQIKADVAGGGVVITAPYGTKPASPA